MAVSRGLPGRPDQLPVTALQIKNAQIYAGVTVSLSAIALSLVVTRLVSRWKSAKGIAADDYFIVAGTVLSLTDVSLIIASVADNLATPPPSFMSFEAIAKKAPMTMAAEVFTQCSVALIKTSIALMLVRLQNTKSWTRFLYAIIALQMLTAIFVTIVQCTRCIPTEAFWNEDIVDKWCWSHDAFKITMTVASSVVIFTDVIFSLIPLTFLHHIRRSAPHRVVIGLLMSLGLLASAASVVKTVMVHRFDVGGDASGNGIAIALWASLESVVGIIAACLPCLRGAFLRLLHRLGIYTEFASRVVEDSSTWPATLPAAEQSSKFEQNPNPFFDDSGRGESEAPSDTEMIVIDNKENTQRRGTET